MDLTLVSLTIGKSTVMRNCSTLEKRFLKSMRIVGRYTFCSTIPIWLLMPVGSRR
jgi:hypothetical protein